METSINSLSSNSLIKSPTHSKEKSKLRRQLKLNSFKLKKTHLKNQLRKTIDNQSVSLISTQILNLNKRMTKIIPSESPLKVRILKCATKPKVTQESLFEESSKDLDAIFNRLVYIQTVESIQNSAELIDSLGPNETKPNDLTFTRQGKIKAHHVKSKSVSYAQQNKLITLQRETIKVDKVSL